METMFSKIVLKESTRSRILEGIRRYYIDGNWTIENDGRVVDKESGKESTYKALEINGIWYFGRVAE